MHGYVDLMFFVFFSRIPGSQNWGFDLRRGKPCLEKWRKIPVDTDILITHGPPVGRHIK